MIKLIKTVFIIFKNYNLHTNGNEEIKYCIYFFTVGVFVFLPIAVNLFLIQHKESKRYLCGKDNQLFGLVS